MIRTPEKIPKEYIPRNGEEPLTKKAIAVVSDVNNMAYAALR